MPRSLGWCTTFRVLGPLALLGALLVTSIDAGAQAPGARVERGRYLVESILGCGNCHTPKTPEGEPIASRNLSGGGLTFSLPPFAGAASNITPDPDTGIGRWSDDDIKRAMVEGKRPNHGRLANTELAVPLNSDVFSALFFVDSGAIQTGPYRVAVGTGLQIMIPQVLGPVPMRFEFATPLQKDDQDEVRVFSFSISRLF